MSLLAALAARKALFNTLAPLVGAAAVFAAGAAAAIAVEHKAPWGLAAKLKRTQDRAASDVRVWREAYDDWRDYGLAEQLAYGRLRALLEAEREIATVAVRQTSQACAGRIAEARRSSAAINTLMQKEIRLDPVTRCPVPGLLGPDELSDALTAAGGRARR